MKSTLYKPTPVLANVVDNYLVVDIDWSQTYMPSIWRLIPYGQISMLLLYGDKHEYSFDEPINVTQTTGNAFLVGQLRRPIWLKFSGHTRLVKVQFKPAGLQQLLPVNMEEFIDVPSIDLEQFWGSAINLLLEQIYDAPSDTERIFKLEEFLKNRLASNNEMIDYVDYTVDRLKATQGNVSIKTLENKLGISTRQLERVFKTRIGLSPKELGKIIRLNSAISQLEANPKLSLTNLSYKAGYFDQAHFSRDFKNIAGISPSKLLSDNGSELFVAQGKCFTQNTSPNAIIID
jgi:AraC-like DNA-binding protein